MRELITERQGMLRGKNLVIVTQHDIDELVDKDERDILEETLDAVEELGLPKVAILKGGFAGFSKRVQEMKLGLGGC